jgi:hypothetical protein
MFRLIIVLLSAIIGCGGGTSGSSSTIVIAKQVKGTVLEDDGRPIAGARVTALASGDFDETDSKGEFLFTTELSDEPQSFLVESPDGREVTLTQIYPEESGDFVLQVVFKRVLTASFRGVSVTASLVGACSGRFFTFNDLLREVNEINLERNGLYLAGFDQLRELKTPAACSLVGSISQSGAPAQGIAWELRAGGCAPSSSEGFEEELDRRTLLASGATDRQGRFSAPFSFNPREGSCNWTFFVRDGLPARLGILISSKFEDDFSFGRVN